MKPGNYCFEIWDMEGFMRVLNQTRMIFFLTMTVVFVLVNCGSNSKPASIKSENNSSAKNKLVDNGDVYGFDTEFKKNLKAIGEISIDAFEKKYGVSGEYLKKISYNPEKAKYFKEVQNSYYKMNGQALSSYKKNGFVVMGHNSMSNFGHVYYKIFKSDLPVFISADSVMHAWHKSFDFMLEELEDKLLSKALSIIIESMALAVPELLASVKDPDVEKMVKSVDEYLAISRSLLSGKMISPLVGDDKTVKKLLHFIKLEQMATVHILGKTREMDFSQFKPRGRYNRSKNLSLYFRAMMWLGRVDMRIVPYDKRESNPQLMAALVLLELLEKAKMMEKWSEFDGIMTTLIGKTDSATFLDLKSIRKSSGFKGFAQYSPRQMKNIVKQIKNSSFGKQAVNSSITRTELVSPKVALPRSFTFLGQKFTMDAWALGKVVYKNISRNKKNVLRTRPSALDIAFTIFNNLDSVGEIVKRIRSGKVAQRDGLEYQHNLAAAKSVIDTRPPLEWKESVYAKWLHTLRSLSNSHKNKSAPELFRTKPWAMRLLNTQFAAWTQLRHDTLLYVKPTYGSSTACYYPHGYVEPNVLFWKRLQSLALLMAGKLEKATYPASKDIRYIIKKGKGYKVTIKDAHMHFLKHFASKVAILKDIARKQKSGVKLTLVEDGMLKNVVQIQRRSSGAPSYNGWYPGLFYKGRHDSIKSDALVADIYTIPSGPGVKGGVLHQAVGRVDTLIAAIKNGKDIITYVGPTLSHYEFFTKGTKRLNDEEWKVQVSSGKTPKRPTWTKSYLLPD
jgi:Protein of unknown function (DUF3160)